MDKEMIERIAPGVANECPYPSVSDEWAIKFLTLALSRIDAERGEDAGGWFVNVNADLDPDNPHFQQVAKQYEGDAEALIAGKDAEIARLRAEVERLTKERDEAVCRKGEIEVVAANQIRQRNATISQQAERIAELEQDSGRVIGWQLKTIEKQSAALAKAREPKPGLFCGSVAISADPRFAGLVFVRHIDGINWTTGAKLTPETCGMALAAIDAHKS